MNPSGLLAALIAALDSAEEPESCLDAALRTLRTHGLAEPPNASSVPWLELRRGGRSLTLAAQKNALPDPTTQALLQHLLGAALARAAEYDDARGVGERMDMLSEASFEGIIIHIAGIPIYVNQGMAELVGYTATEMLDPHAMLRSVAPEDLAEAQRRIRDRVQGEFLLTLVRKDGTRFRAEFRTKQGLLGDRPVRVVALRDVTERERTAELLRESEQRLRQILEATFDCVVLNRNGVVVDIGAGADVFFGYTREQLLQRPVLDLVAPSAREDVAQRLQEQIAGTYETTVINAQNELIPVEITSVVSTLDGEPVRVAGLRDLRAARRLAHERRRLELQLERSQRLESLGVLAGGIAHDFNNLLVGVLGGAQLLLDTLQDPEERETAETIRMAGERAASLTRQMLVYAGRRELQAPAPVDLNLISRELRQLLDAALSKKAQLELALAPDSVVLGDRATLTQVLMNLLTNASDALADKPGVIRVSSQRVRKLDARWDDALGATVRPGEWVLLEVRDNGVGMDESTQRRIFEPFFSTKARGHGLGLGSCLGIIAAHGGAILVESAPDQGSTFSLLLPATPARSWPPEPRAFAPAITRPCRVLIVDDEPLVRTHMRRLLELRGFSVQDAKDGHSGLEAVARAAPDLIVLDFTMPDLDGIEVVRRLRATGSRVPVVLCSGNLDYATERGLAPGMVQGILHKPFSSEELIEALERARS